MIVHGDRSARIGGLVSVASVWRLAPQAVRHDVMELEDEMLGSVSYARSVLFLGLILTLPFSGSEGQQSSASIPEPAFAVTPEISIGRWVTSGHSRSGNAVSIGLQLELPARRPLSVTVDANAWGSSVMCPLGISDSPCGETGVSGIVGLRYAPPFAIRGRMTPWLGGGGGMIRWNDGVVAAIGSARIGVDVGLGARSSLRAETRYQPIWHSGYAEQLHMFAMGLRILLL